MALSIYNIKKWYRMLTGRSILHVNQDIGQCFVPGEIKGYFNNLTEKVTKEPLLLEQKLLPASIDAEASEFEFPVAIFQYGLGCYDLFLLTKEVLYLEQFFRTVDWAMEHQLKKGEWDNFGFIYPEAPYGAMCQGEGTSLLLRAYIQTDDKKYLQAAKKAVDFMLLPIEQGGTAGYEKENLYLYEYTHSPLVLNGWIFSLIGLYEMSLVDSNYQKKFDCAVNTLLDYLPRFDNGYWSMYDLGGAHYQSVLP